MHKRIITILCTILSVFQFCLACSEEIQSARRLLVDATFPDQALNKQTCLYTIEDLEEKARYELRISYPAIIPTDFILEVEEKIKAISSRKLLNVEQLQWNAKGQSYIIKVKAHRTGVPIDLKRLQDPVSFNIIVNRLYLGCSLATWKIVVSITLFVVVVLKFSLSPLLNMVDKMDNKTD